MHRTEHISSVSQYVSARTGELPSRRQLSSRGVPAWIRYTLVLASAVVASVVLAAQPLLVAAAAKSGLTTASLVAVSALAELPIVIAAALAAATIVHRGARDAVDRGDWRRLAASLDLAEGTLDGTQDRIHELRATLGGLRLSHQLLVDRGPSMSQAARRRLQLLHGAELERVERLLTVHSEDRVSPVELAEVVDPLVDVMALRGCDVQWQGTRSQVRGRADDITEIVHVLLDNAVRHAAGHGVRLGVTTRGGWVELSVRDRGPGVSRFLVPVVFDRGTHAPDSTGEGRGLHAARRLARELGGDLRLEPQHRDGGAEFVLRLPQAKGHASCLAPAV